MPPKKQDKQPKAAKTSVDKTFGMKNKKGGAAQKQIKQIQAQAASSKTPDQKRKEAEKEQREREKAAAEAAKRETADLFKPVQVQKVPFGVDPKSVVCQFFKNGNCEKGRKCKFSHDLDAGRKQAKKNLYEDTRDGENGEDDTKKKDDMADWDEAKLRSVVMSKHGNLKTTTDKVCKFFIEAVENGKYGWFWICPNGGDTCKYRHSLPPGFVLKTKEQRAAERAAMESSPLHTLTLEDWLETERHKLTGPGTPVTMDSFAEWKKKRLDKKQAEEEARRAKEATGRMLFDQGGWEGSDNDSDDGDDDDEDPDAWNMQAMMRETEAARAKKEEERLRKQYGVEAGGGDEGDDYEPDDTGTAEGSVNGSTNGTS